MLHMRDTHSKFVALLRGVNVGEANKVPMAQLRALAQTLGWTDIQTYIASGNLVFSAKGDPIALGATLRSALIKQMDVDVPVMVLSETIVRKLNNGCPFEDVGNRIHLYICEAEPVINNDLQTQFIAADETIVVDGGFVWFHTPSGFGRSKLAAKMERVLGVSATARNLNTIQKLATMLHTE